MDKGKGKATQVESAQQSAASSPLAAPAPRWPPMAAVLDNIHQLGPDDKQQDLANHEETNVDSYEWTSMSPVFSSRDKGKGKARARTPELMTQDFSFDDLVRMSSTALLPGMESNEDTAALAVAQAKEAEAEAELSRLLALHQELEERINLCSAGKPPVTPGSIEGRIRELMREKQVITEPAPPKNNESHTTVKSSEATGSNKLPEPAGSNATQDLAQDLFALAEVHANVCSIQTTLLQLKLERSQLELKVYSRHLDNTDREYTSGWGHNQFAHLSDDEITAHLIELTARYPDGNIPYPLMSFGSAALPSDVQTSGVRGGQRELHI